MPAYLPDHIPQSSADCMYCGGTGNSAAVAELRRTLAARDRLIALLTKRLGGAGSAPGTELPAQQAHILGRLVETKTRQLENERFNLEKTLTELRAAQDRLIQGQKLESIGELAAGVAHELNTPTQYVTDNVGFVERGVAALLEVIDVAIATTTRLREQGQVASLEEFDAAVSRARLGFLRTQLPLALEQSLEGLERVANIVRAMKDYAHPAIDEKELVNLEELIDATVTLARSEWKYVAKLSTNVHPQLPAVPCLRQELSQALLNLIVNAAHAIHTRSLAEGREKGHIVISARDIGDYAEIRVEDDGTGIPEEIRSRIFDPFFTTKPVGQGTGQGLALVFAMIVKRHQGRIRVESEVGRGTAMVILLPMTALSAPEA